MFADEPVGINRCFAAVCRGGDGLSVSEVSNISGCEYSGNVRFSFIPGDNVASGIEFHLSFEYRSVWVVSDCNEDAVCLENVFFSSFEVSTPDPCNIAVSQYLINDGIPDEFYLRVFQGTLLHYLTGTYPVPTMDHGYRPCDVGKKRRLLQSRISAADHNHVLLFEEVA